MSNNLIKVSCQIILCANRQKLNSPLPSLPVGEGDQGVFQNWQRGALVKKRKKKETLSHHDH